MNKKGLLGNLVGGFIIIFVAICLFGTISQEIDNILNCNNTSFNSTNVSQYEKPIGTTDSFGGGGTKPTGQFGGYDGKVYKSWSSNLALIKTNQSIINPDCTTAPKGLSKTFLQLSPYLFIIITGLFALIFVFFGFKNAGLV